MKYLKLQFSTLIICFTGLMSFAQVGVGATAPQGILDVVSANSSIIFPRSQFCKYSSERNVIMRHVL